MVTQIIKYQTVDEHEFDTEAQAVEHETVLDLVKELDASPIYWRETSSTEVAEWLCERYTLVRK